MHLTQFGAVVLTIGFVCCAGCGAPDVEIVDLNKVLDVLVATLDELDSQDSEQGEVEVQALQASEEIAANEGEFLNRFADNLNDARLIDSFIGVEMHTAGDIKGFKDSNSNNKRDGGEKDLFLLQVDAEQNRLIASDGDGHYRDQGYRPMGGFFTAYMIGSMMGRGNAFYSGNRASLKPNFEKTKMSPKNYHASAVSSARAKARSSSARSRSGSRGFSFGK